MMSPPVGLYEKARLKRAFFIEAVMERQSILILLEKYTPTGKKQNECRDKMISFIEGNPHCFQSLHPPKQGNEIEIEMGHITGSAWVLSPDKKSVLLTHHRKLNKWLQLGGHSDGESNVLLTALREAKEESGIVEINPLSHSIFDIDIHTFPKKKNVEAHLHYDIRFCLQAMTSSFSVSEESHSLRWVPLQKIGLENFEESIVRMAEKTNLFLEKI